MEGFEDCSMFNLI